MKIQVPGAYIYFALGVILVTALTFIELPCPVDGGTGVLTGARDLRITGVEAELADYALLNLGCGYPWIEFTYAVSISVVNEATAPSHGAVVVSFYDPAMAAEPIYGGEGGNIVEALALEFLGPPMERIPIFVKIPPETAETIERVIVFNGLFRREERALTHNISVRIPKEIACPYSGGTGKVPLTEWLWLKASVQ